MNPLLQKRSREVEKASDTCILHLSSSSLYQHQSRHLAPTDHMESLVETTMFNPRPKFK